MKKNFNSIFFTAVLFLLFLEGCKHQEAPSKDSFVIEQQPWGRFEGKTVTLFALRAPNGFEVSIMDYGATVVSMIVPDKDGQPGDVLLGFDSLSGYLQNGNPYIGCTVGRYANRIANASFQLDGQEFLLFKNDTGNTLHGGNRGFDKHLWTKVESGITDTSAYLALRYLSQDGEEGYPGNLGVTVVFTVDKKFGFQINYTAETDQPTPVNLTNHAYFNLSAGRSEDILGHELQLFASRYTPVNAALIPVGTIDSVKLGPMDFTLAKAIGKEIGKVPGGYDHNFVLDPLSGASPNLAAILKDPLSGRTMEMFTTEPGVQFYSGNFLDGTLKGKGGRKMPKHHGLCLEAQHFPDSPNQPGFPSTILLPGKVYRQTTIYRFPNAVPVTK